MKKEEILKKYREEVVDEGWVHAQNEGFACGYVMYAVVAFLIFFMNLSFRYSGSECFFGAFFFATCAIDNHSKYIFLKEKKYLRRMLFFILWVLLILLIYYLEVAGG